MQRVMENLQVYRVRFNVTTSTISYLNLLRGNEETSLGRGAALSGRTRRDKRILGFSRRPIRSLNCTQRARPHAVSPPGPVRLCARSHHAGGDVEGFDCARELAKPLGK